MTNTDAVTAAIAGLVDAHLNDKPGKTASAEEWRRHCRVGDKLLELLIETIEVGDGDFFSAIQAQQQDAPTEAPTEALVVEIATPTVVPEITFGGAHDQDAALPQNTTEIRRELRQAFAGSKKKSREREQVYIDALNVTAINGKWWLAEAARALNINLNTMQAAVKRIDPTHPRLHNKNWRALPTRS